jgi:hypothetical protein
MNYEIKYIRFDNETKRFEFKVFINGVSFDYWVGMGWAKYKKSFKPIEDRQYLGESKLGLSQEDKTNWKRVYGDEAWNNPLMLEVPCQWTVLDSLFLDAGCGDQTFVDFCDDLGYNNDSISALKTYMACQENGVKLRKALGKDFEKIRKETMDNCS